MAESQDKGKDLEYALQQIEEVIIKKDPQFRGCGAIVERNKIVEVAGTHHEIDIWVSVNPDTQFPSIHIFECKNWARPVGKNEVMVLAGKCKAVRASSATFIARSFTKDAENQAKQEHVTLHRFTGADPSDFGIRFVSHKIESGVAQVGYSKSTPSAPTTLDIQASCMFGGQKVTFESIVDQLISEHLNKLTDADPRKELPGQHMGTTEINKLFPPNQLIIEGREASAICIELAYSTVMAPPEKRTSFVIPKLGGFHRFEYDTSLLGGKNLTLEVITNPKG